MKIKFGSIVTDGRGKLGGQVYARNRSGAYVRNKVTPNNPQTIAQSAARSRLAKFSEQWRGLSQAQRDAWNAAAPDFAKTNVFGDSVNPTGKNLFTQLNVNLADIRGPVIENPPVPVEISEPGELTIVANSAPELSVSFEGVEGQSYKIFATPPLSPGVGFFKNKFRMIDTHSGPADTPINLFDKYNAKFGSFDEGQKVAIKVVPVVDSTGQKGIGSVGSQLVTAP